MTTSTREIVAVLNAHQEQFYGTWAECSCGDWATTADGSPEGSDGPHRAHVAEQIERMLAERRVTEWAVEVTWRDAKKAGSDTPTSQYGPFSAADRADSFNLSCRRDRSMTATRILTRQASYTDWAGRASLSVSGTERERLLDEYLNEISNGLGEPRNPPG